MGCGHRQDPRQKTYLTKTTGTDGIARYDAAALPPSGCGLLASPRYAQRTAIRLDERFKHQGYEIDRVLKWLAAIEKSTADYPLVDGRLSLTKAPKHLHTLINRYRGEPSIALLGNAIVARRKEAKRLQANILANTKSNPAARQPITQPALDYSIDAVFARGLEEERKLARSRYPDARVAARPELRAFLNALRDVASNDKIIACSDAVTRSSEAAAEAMQHGTNLATAYHSYSRDFSAREAAATRSGRSSVER